MDNKTGEHIEEAVRLWRQAHASLEQQDVLVYLERAMRFHKFLSNQLAHLVSQICGELHALALRDHC